MAEEGTHSVCALLSSMFPVVFDILLNWGHCDGWWRLHEELAQGRCELSAVVNRLTCRLIHWKKADQVLLIRAGSRGKHLIFHSNKTG